MRIAITTFAFMVLLTPVAAYAAFHLWDITEVYSNQDGTVQFIELATNTNFQDELAGHTLTSDLATYTFPTDLDPDAMGNGNDATANQHMLVATPAFASQPGAVTPDFVLDGPDFFDFVQDALDFAGWDTFGWTAGELPTNGVDSLHEPFGSNDRTVDVNSPTNFAGDVGELPEPGGTGALLAGAAAVAVLARRRGRARRGGSRGDARPTRVAVRRRWNEGSRPTGDTAVWPPRRGAHRSPSPTPPTACRSRGRGRGAGA